MDAVTSERQNVSRFEARCRELGIPLTVQRRVIFKALMKREDHPTVDDIFEAIKEKIQGVSRATVYRVLETFVQAGIVRHVCSDGSAVRFDPKLSHHHHLVCSRCSSVSDFDDARLDRLPVPNRQRTGFEVQTYSVYFKGLCRQCLKNGDKPSQKSGKRKTRNGKER